MASFIIRDESIRFGALDGLGSWRQRAYSSCIFTENCSLAIFGKVEQTGATAPRVVLVRLRVLA